MTEQPQSSQQAPQHSCPYACCLSLDFILANRQYDLEAPEPSWWRPLRRAYWKGHRDATYDVLDDAGK